MADQTRVLTRWWQRLRGTDAPPTTREPWTPERVDREAGDDLHMRHLLFLRFVLGEPLTDAGLMAILASRARWCLTVGQMRHVAEHWHEDEHECDDCPTPERKHQRVPDRSKPVTLDNYWQNKLDAARDQRDGWHARANELEAENERLREGIRTHRETSEAVNATSPADHRLWALLPATDTRSEDT